MQNRNTGHGRVSMPGMQYPAYGLQILRQPAGLLCRHVQGIITSTISPLEGLCQTGNGLLHALLFPAGSRPVEDLQGKIQA